MLLTSLDLKYFNKAVDFVENKHGFKVVLINQKEMGVYQIDAKYGDSDEYYQLKVDARSICEEPTMISCDVSL